MLAKDFDGRPDNYKRGQSKGGLTLPKSKKEALSDAGFSTHQQRTISRIGAIPEEEFVKLAFSE
jgi:hypothetical protein